MRYYITADPLKKALEEKGYFSDPEPHKLIICGDLFDLILNASPLKSLKGFNL